MSAKTWQNGTLRAGVCLDSAQRALLQGDGLFETIRVRRGIALSLSRHLGRLVLSAARSGYSWTALDEHLLERLHEPLGAAKLVRSGALRVYVYPSTHDGSPEVFATLEEYVPPSESEYHRGQRFHISAVVHPGHGLFGKTTSRHWAATAGRLGRQAGYDGVVLLDVNGYVVEAANASLLWSVGGAWFSADRRLGGLEGTTLEEMEQCGLQVTRVRVTADHLKRADAIVAVSSLRIAMGLRSIDDVELQNPDVQARMLRTLIFD